MMSSYRLSLLMLISMLTFSCSNTQPPTCEEYILNNRAFNEFWNVGISFPENYIVDDESELAIAAVKSTEHPDEYIESCGIATLKNSLNYNLDEFFTLSLNADETGYQEEYSNYRVHEKGSSIINDNDAKWVIYSYGDEKILSYFFIKDDNLLRVLCLSKENDFDSLRCKYEKIIQTIELP